MIAGTDQDAEVLRYAARDETEFQGTGISAVVALTIRNADDTDVTTTTGITIDQLIKQYGLPGAPGRQPGHAEPVPVVAGRGPAVTQEAMP